MEKQIKEISLLGVDKSKLHLPGFDAKSQHLKVVMAKPDEELPDLIAIELYNNTGADKFFTLLNNPELSYEAFAGIISAAQVVEADVEKAHITCDHPAGIEGLRSALRRREVFVPSFNYDVLVDGQIPQFGKDIFLLESTNLSHQDNRSLKAAVNAAKNSNNQEQTQRMVPLDKVLNGNRDLVLQVRDGATVIITLYAAGYKFRSK